MAFPILPFLSKLLALIKVGKVVKEMAKKVSPKNKEVSVEVAPNIDMDPSIGPMGSFQGDRRNWSNDVKERKAYAMEHGGYWYGSGSWKKLMSCHPKIQSLFVEAIKYFNLSVDCGTRGRKAQEKAKAEKRSDVNYPDSIHNPDNPVNADKKGVRAIDVLPYPVDWKDKERFMYTGGKIMLLAKQMDIPMRWGADWNRDSRMRDDDKRKALRDYPHFEYREGEEVI